MGKVIIETGVKLKLKMGAMIRSETELKQISIALSTEK